MVTIQRYTDPVQFLERVAPYACQAEAAHNLLLGLMADLRHNLHAFGPEVPGLFGIEQAGTIVGAAVWTPPHALLLSDIATELRLAALQAIADDLDAATERPTGVTGPSAIALAFAELWYTRHAIQHTKKLAMRIYELTKVAPPVGVSGQIRKATIADTELLVEWIAAFEAEAHNEPVDYTQARQSVLRWQATPSRSMYLWEDAGQPVSLAGCAGPTPHGIRISAVYTPPERRGHGYASACVAAASQAQLDQGRKFCTLFTDLTNPTSNKIYQQVGYRPVCDVDEYLFH